MIHVVRERKLKLLPYSVPVITDINFFLKPLRTELFPGVSGNVKTHDGFGDAHARSVDLFHTLRVLSPDR